MSRSIAVLIPTCRRPDLLRRTLEHLSECVLPECFMQTIVVENGGEQQCKQICVDADSRLRIEYRYHAVGNKSMALNSVLQELNDELVLFFDDDVRCDPQVLLAYAEAEEKSDGGEFYGGSWGIDFESGPPDEWLKPFLPPSSYDCEFDEEQREFSQPLFMGYNWAAVASDLLKVGGFNPVVGPGGSSGSTGQETDMQERLLAAGVRGVFVPEAKVWHWVTTAECTSSWALRRVYRHAIWEGLRMQDACPHLLGIPRWLLKTAITAGLRAAVGSLSPSRVSRFRRWYEYQQLRGIMHGYRFQLQSDMELKRTELNADECVLRCEMSEGESL